MRLAHDPGAVERLRSPSIEDPWRVLLSGCLAGWGCGVDGTHYGMGGCLDDLFALPGIVAVPACPEEYGLGVPRTMPDLHGGDGVAVLAGRARVLDEHGVDLTEGMRIGAAHTLGVARAAAVDFAILTDMSAACGTQVISDGCRFDTPRRFQRGVGVAAARLIEAGIPVVSQRDHRTLGTIRQRLDPTFVPDPDALDHHEHPWTVAHFGL